MNRIKPKSFSELWEDAENIASGWYSTEPSCDLFEIIKNINIEDKEAQEKAFGEILFIMAYLSSKYNINVYTALGKHVISKKEEVLENTLGGEADLFRGQSKS